MIYLDHNATTPMLPEVIEAMAQCLRDGYGNPASSHQPGRKARRLLEAARTRIGELLGAQLDGTSADRVIFTSGGTESNNLAVRGLATQSPAHGIISVIEHPSVEGPAQALEQQGWRIDRLSVSSEGIVQTGQLSNLINDQTRFVSVMLGNNETGVIQPIADIAQICQAAHTPFHVDASQAVGKIQVGFSDLAVDLLTATAHKLHGPCGIGVLLLRGDQSLDPILFGGFQQQGLRPGTESLALVIGFQTALECWFRDQDARMRHLLELRDSLEAGILSGWPTAIVIGKNSPRLPQTSNIAFPGFDRQALLMALDMAGVACSTGSACASGSSEPSPVLIAMGCEEAVIGGALRFSVGATTTAAEIDEAVRQILKIVNGLHAI